MAMLGKYKFSTMFVSKMPHHKPNKKHKPRKANKRKHSKTPIMSESREVKQASDNQFLGKFVNFASQAFTFTCETVTSSAKYYAGKVTKLVLPSLISSSPVIGTTIKLASKLKIQDKYDALSAKLTSELSPAKKKAAQVILATGTIAATAYLMPQYNPWHYIPCLAGSVAIKKFLDRLSRRTKDQHITQGFTNKLARAYFKRMMILQTLGAAGITATNLAPIFFITKPVLDRGLDLLINDDLIPITRQLSKLTKKEVTSKISKAKAAVDILARHPLAKKTLRSLF